ncbi:MAG: limonene-1,2-epoxide hydrolase family protein [Parvibaculum sp.]|nr:limonene-1,2-epoxide hydrolase family protein [Parvibaculum sp.]|tara:strand:+ start:295 stop:663 length:369 start_codon:yes stop_codon:yes gene_type:complete
MNKNEEIIRDFVNAWPSLDVEKIVSFFTEDGIYHNMMIHPVKGHADLRNFISAFLKGWSETEWEILNLASSGNTVFAERVDRTKVGGKPVSLPCCGVFEMENGKIKAWRDYFDMGTYTKALA